MFAAILIPIILSLHGRRTRSLSTSGAATALVVGFLMIAGDLKAWGVALIAMYLVGSRATKFKKERKAKLESGYSDYGNRSGWQVLSNSFSALVACFVWNVLFQPNGIHANIASKLSLDAYLPRPTVSYNGEWCPASADGGNTTSRALLFAALGHFACCLGDTLASELGIVSSSTPRLIFSWKPVPPGTNGAISLGGTLSSLIGGLIMGLVLTICLVAENNACRIVWRTIGPELLLWGAFGGVVGSGIDSILGATIQLTRYDEERKLVVEDHAQGKRFRVVSGLDLLTNNQVNVVASTITAVIVAVLA
ncbi:Integral membrane family protein [Mycena kentingensis (nom. inval.)]|nr:Integral membrane family protein [Mycena kentingensis (nom. inval.)]